MVKKISSSLLNQQEARVIKGVLALRNQKQREISTRNLPAQEMVEMLNPFAVNIYKYIFFFTKATKTVREIFFVIRLAFRKLHRMFISFKHE